jgi:tetratricopeptide (TPR) repeat protein
MAVQDNSGTVLELAISFTQLGCTHFALSEYERASHYHKKALSFRASNLDFNSALVSESLNYCADSLQALGCGREALPLAMHAVKIRQVSYSTVGCCLHQLFSTCGKPNFLM